MARLDRVRQARRDASLEITLRVSDDQRRGADGVVLKFDTPSKCVAWWTALSRARLEALGERGWQSALYERVATEKPFLGFGGANSSTTARDTPALRVALRTHSCTAHRLHRGRRGGRSTSTPTASRGRKPASCSLAWLHWRKTSTTSIFRVTPNNVRLGASSCMTAASEPG